ncbi:hypothetical protein [Nostoc sp.]|uniref:hypothetical protein n=1 Tax=Nostoc sp. TaxID=1180 RepID=UPI002FF5A708
MRFTLQLLHVSDFECGIDTTSTSPQTSDAVCFLALLIPIRNSQLINLDAARQSLLTSVALF